MVENNNSIENAVGKKTPASELWASYLKLIRYLSPYKVALALMVIFSIASSVFSIVSPRVLALITDELVSGVARKVLGGIGIDFSFIAKVATTLLLIYLLSLLFSFIQGYIMAGVSAKVSQNMRTALIRKINKLPISYFHKVSYGDTLSRITNDVDTLEQSLNQSASQLISSVTTIVGVAIMMLTISTPLTLMTLLILPLSYLLVSKIVKRGQRYFVEGQDNLGAVNGKIEESFGGQSVIKVFNMQERTLDEFDEINDKLYQSSWKSNFLSGLMQPAMGFVSNMGYVIICILGSVFAAGGLMTIGAIGAFMQYIRNFMMPITQLANISTMVMQTAAASNRVFSFLEEEEENDDSAQKKIADYKISGNIRFENVRFSYEAGKTIISNFSADIKAGQKIAIVGPTGAGKTTLVKLMMHFHELDSGAIYLDGHNINDFTRQDLRQKFGMVLQDTWLYNDTIMENIRYGRPDATDEEVRTAARAASASSFIKALPKGYNFLLNEEASNISQGQKQLITIARALLSNSEIMILDEATSSVDTRTETLIQKAMDAVMHGRTSFVIAHRLSTIKNADIILVLKEGDIVEQGSHDELLSQKGFYFDLYNSQFDTEE